MKTLNELLSSLVEDTYENIIIKDEKYQKIEREKLEILSHLKAKLSSEDLEQVQNLLSYAEQQNLITAMGFSFIRILELDRVLGNLSAQKDA